MKLETLTSVLVPFEKVGEQWVKRDDLPRFTRTAEVIWYLMNNPDKSYRKDERGERVYVRIDWMEYSEPDLIKEYTDGVGTTAFLLRQQRKPK